MYLTVLAIPSLIVAFFWSCIKVCWITRWDHWSHKQMICKMAFLCCLKAGELIGLFICVWKTGQYYFHFTIFYYYFILKPFFTNVLDWMVFGGVSFGIRKILMTIWYHAVPLGAYFLYDFAYIYSPANNDADLASDNIGTIHFQTWYENWKFYWTLITIFPTSMAGAFISVYSKKWIIKNEGHKMWLKEREKT